MFTQNFVEWSVEIAFNKVILYKISAFIQPFLLSQNTYTNMSLSSPLLRKKVFDLGFAFNLVAIFTQKVIFMKQTSKKLSEQKKARGNTKKTAKDMSYVSRVNPFPKFDW